MVALVIEAHVTALTDNRTYKDILSESPNLNYSIDIKLPDWDSQKILDIYLTKRTTVNEDLELSTDSSDDSSDSDKTDKTTEEQEVAPSTSSTRPKTTTKTASTIQQKRKKIIPRRETKITNPLKI